MQNNANSRPETQAWIGGQNLYTNTARKGPPQTPRRLFLVYMYFPAFSLETKLFGIHQTSFLPVEALEFSELKTPLVYAFFPPNGNSYKMAATGWRTKRLTSIYIQSLLGGLHRDRSSAACSSRADHQVASLTRHWISVQTSRYRPMT